MVSRAGVRCGVCASTAAVSPTHVYGDGGFLRVSSGTPPGLGHRAGTRLCATGDVWGAVRDRSREPRERRIGEGVTQRAR